jgi:hypothetical protein
MPPFRPELFVLRNCDVISIAESCVAYLWLNPLSIFRNVQCEQETHTLTWLELSLSMDHPELY